MPSKLALGPYLTDDWFPAFRSTIRPSTFDPYRRTLDFHVIPALGTTPLAKLHPGQLNALYGTLARAERPLAAETICYLFVPKTEERLPLETAPIYAQILLFYLVARIGFEPMTFGL